MKLLVGLLCGTFLLLGVLLNTEDWVNQKRAESLQLLSAQYLQNLDHAVVQLLDVTPSPVSEAHTNAPCFLPAPPHPLIAEYPLTEYWQAIERTLNCTETPSLSHPQLMALQTSILQMNSALMKANTAHQAAIATSQQSKRPFNIVILLGFFSTTFGLIGLIGRHHQNAIARLTQNLHQNRSDFARSQGVMLSVMEDIRRQEQNALTLARDNQQLAAIVETAQDAIIKIDEALNVLHANPSAGKLLNIRTQDETPLLPHNLVQPLKGAMAQLTPKSPSTNMTFEYTSGDVGAASIHLYITITILPSQSLKQFEYAIILRDITHLQRQSEYLIGVIQHLPNALIMANTQGNIIMCNQEAALLFGYSSDELIGTNINALVPAPFKHHHADLIQSFFASPKAKTMGKGQDLSAVKKSGEHFPAEIALNPMPTGNNMVVLASILDLSDRLKAQRHLEFINKELEQRNFEMEQFLYTVSHDLKSPLVTIGGFADRLQKTITEQLSEKQKHQLQRIRANVINMDAILNDLLELSRVFKSDISKQWIDAQKLVGNVLSALEGDIERHHAAIQIHTPLHDIYVNERLASQCIQNVIANAIKYRDPARQPHIFIRTEEDEHQIKLIIQDNGLGIEPRHQERIFRIFERLEIGEGNGIGLTIVKTVMDKHDGTVTLRSTPGKGSIFTLNFPAPDKH